MLTSAVRSLLFAYFASSVLLFSLNASAAETNVILLTMDGVRWDEVFHGTDSRITRKASRPIMVHLKNELSAQGVLLGDIENSSVEVSNAVNLSLPAYQNIFAGAPTSCKSNLCNKMKVETFPERLVGELALDKMDVAGFASWGPIKNAFSSHPGNAYLNAGLEPVLVNDHEHELINLGQKTDVPRWNNKTWSGRYDRYTFAHALRYLTTRKPRFLYISLLDADQYAHARKYSKYVQAIAHLDDYIYTLAETLDSMGEYGKNTLLIVTTDHGRGAGRATWAGHGKSHPHSKKIWMYLRGKGVIPGKTNSTVQGDEYSFSHNDLRPTIERALGLNPDPQAPGKVIVDASR